MNELTKFDFSGMAVRVVTINNEPWWCASDVCAILCYANGRDTVKRHCKEGGVVKHDTPTDSAIQSMTYINESNLPYQPYIDRGYFQVKERPLKKGDKTELFSQPFVTAKGLEYINNMMPDGMVTV